LQENPRNCFKFLQFCIPTFVAYAEPQFLVNAGMPVVIPNEQRSASNKRLRDVEKQRKLNPNLKKEGVGVVR
jgi:hypothetical protein